VFAACFCFAVNYFQHVMTSYQEEEKVSDRYH